MGKLSINGPFSIAILVYCKGASLLTGCWFQAILSSHPYLDDGGPTLICFQGVNHQGSYHFYNTVFNQFNPKARGGVPYSSRFATRTTRTQRIGQRGKERAYLAQPKPTGVKPGRPWPLKLGRTGAHLRTRTSWLQLGRNLSPTGRNLSPTGFQHGAAWGHVWTQVGLSMRNLVLCGGMLHRRPKTSPMWAT